MGSYSRTGYLAIKVETTENTYVTPDVFVPLMSEDIVTEWGDVPAVPVSGNRSNKLRALSTAIPAPSGTVNILVEPKTIGYFLRGVYGAVSSGQLMKVTEVSGDWAAADTATGGSSSKTATVDFISTEDDYFLISSPSGAFTDGESLSNGSTGVATLTQHDATVYGHQFAAPQSSLPTFTVEIGFDNEAYRYGGVRFNAINSLAQNDNIITAALQMTARSEFKHARVTAITTAAGGSQTITVDQTTGLVVGDSIKLWRPSISEFVPFEGASDYIHTIDTIPTEKTFTITVLQSATAVGDLIVLAPMTPSYTIDEEFTWIGGSVVRTADAIATTLEDYVVESLDETDFATHANWDVVGDFNDSGGNAAYTHSAGTGTLTQVAADQNTAAVGNVWYEFTYTTSGYTGDVAGTLTTGYALTAETLTLSTAGIHTLVFKSAVAPVDFVLSLTSSSGGVTIDDVSLRQMTPSDSIEDFEMVLTNELESRHGADGIDVKDRFPANNFLKGVTGSGNIVRTYTDQNYLDMLRENREKAIYVEHTGNQIGTTGQYFELDWRMPNVQFQPFNPSISEDDLLNQEMSFEMYYSSDDGYFQKALLTNNIASY